MLLFQMLYITLYVTNSSSLLNKAKSQNFYEQEYSQITVCFVLQFNPANPHDDGKPKLGAIAKQVSVDLPVIGLLRSAYANRDPSAH